MQEDLGAESLLLHLETIQLRWQMPPGLLPGEVFQACPTRSRAQGWAQVTKVGGGYLLSAGLGKSQYPPDELEEVDGEKELWAYLQPNPQKVKEKEVLF